MEKVAKAVLRHLFQQYQKAPAILYSINGVTNQYKADPIAVSEYLMEKKWIREHWVHQNNLVTCRITVEGIEEVNPSFVHAKLQGIISVLANGGGSKSLAEIYQTRIEDYAMALDIIYQLQMLGLVTIISQAGTLHIELTVLGRKYDENPSKPLLTLMAIA
jgi:hypothetical protein